jgi:hypothetical protein
MSGLATYQDFGSRQRDMARAESFLAMGYFLAVACCEMLRIM